MTALNARARDVIKWSGYETPAGDWRWATIAGYVRHYFPDGVWSGDACGCTDDRCKDGYHHDPHEECGCLRVLLDAYVCGLRGHRWSDRILTADYGHGRVRWQLCMDCTEANYLVPA